MSFCVLRPNPTSIEHNIEQNGHFTKGLCLETNLYRFVFPNCQAFENVFFYWPKTNIQNEMKPIEKEPLKPNKMAIIFLIEPSDRPSAPLPFIKKIKHFQINYTVSVDSFEVISCNLLLIIGMCINIHSTYHGRTTLCTWARQTSQLTCSILLGKLEKK